MKASLDKVVKIAEIIGSLGIVISLIFVSIQYQNNSLALQTSTANSVNANIADWYTAFFENAEASEAFMKFVSAPESVTPSERFRAIMRLHSLNLHLQNALYLEGKGVLDENLRKTISMASLDDAEKILKKHKIEKLPIVEERKFVGLILIKIY